MESGPLDALDVEAGSPASSVVPEATGLLDNFVYSGGRINFEYQAGLTSIDSDKPKVEIIAVTEVDQQALVAVPDLAWHRHRSRRQLADDCLTKAVRVDVVCASALDRTTPEDVRVKVWLGLLRPSYNDQVVYGTTAGPEDIVFPVDSVGLPMMPHAEAMKAVAQDHFTFFSPESNLDGDQDQEDRLSKLENSVAEILQVLKGQKPPSRPATPPPAGGPKAKSKTSALKVPQGLDPQVVMQARAAGISEKALKELGQALRDHPAQLPPVDPQYIAPAVTSDEDEDDVDLGNGSGPRDPVEKALVSLTKIVGEMRKEKKERKSKDLESILDRAESGSSKEAGVSSRSKAAALRSLQKLLITQPKLIYTALEAHMQEDWEMGGQRLPGAQIAQISARGWLEHRSRISSYPGTIRPAWLCAGIWDALMAGRYEEARARAAIATACFDQQACNRGGWLLSSELTLEPPPPYASFAQHSAPDVWEVQHSRLIDDRWMELFLSRLKDMAEYQEKKSKLTAGRGRREENSQQPKAEPPKKTKGKGGKKGKEKESEAAASADS